MSVVPGSEPGKLLKVLGDGCQKELVRGTVWTSQPQPGQVEGPLEVGKQHLDLFPLITRRLVGLRLATPSDRTCLHSSD